MSKEASVSHDQAMRTDNAVAGQDDVMATRHSAAMSQDFTPLPDLVTFSPALHAAVGRDGRHLLQTMLSWGILSEDAAQIPMNNITPLIWKQRPTPSTAGKLSNLGGKVPRKSSQTSNHTDSMQSMTREGHSEPVKVPYTIAPFAHMVEMRQQSGQVGRAQHQHIHQINHLLSERGLDVAQERTRKTREERKTDGERRFHRHTASASVHQLLAMDADTRRCKDRVQKRLQQSVAAHEAAAATTDFGFGSVLRHQQKMDELQDWKRRHEDLMKETKQKKEKHQNSLTDQLAAVRSYTSCAARSKSTAKSRAVLFGCEQGAIARIVRKHDLRARQESDHVHKQTAAREQREDEELLLQETRDFLGHRNLRLQEEARRERHLAKVERKRQEHEHMQEARSRVKASHEERLKSQSEEKIPQVPSTVEVLDFVGPDQLQDRFRPPVKERQLYIRTNPHGVRRAEICMCHTPRPYQV